MSIGIFDYKELYTLYDSVLHEANFDYFRKNFPISSIVSSDSLRGAKIQS